VDEGATTAPGQVRLAELVAALSLGIDLGFGQPMEHVLRQCLIALRLADRVNLDVAARTDVYYTALLINVGCHADAHEQAKWFGDDIALKSTKYDGNGVRAAATTLRRLGSGHPLLSRFRIGLEFAVSGYREVNAMITQHARMARQLAEQLQLPNGVLDGVGSAYEQWDGHGWPGEAAGAQVPVASRIAQLSEYVEVAHRIGGVEAVRALAARRSGKQIDPALADVVIANADELLADIESKRTWDSVIAGEPSLSVTLSADGFDSALVAVANFVDLKSPFTLGHATAVAELAGESGRVIGADAQECRTLYRAGLVHGFGRLGVSNAIWDRPGPLSAGERERVRMYPYLTERMLHQSPALGPLGRIAVAHRERLDGSGYPRGLSGGSIPWPARILAAAEAYQTKREPRPHRPEQSRDDTARHLHQEVTAGRLDGQAVHAVLRAAGHRVPRRADGPAGLTTREVEVLRLLARGLSNKEIAQRLVITPKTAGNHIEHIYLKIHASTRAAAALFAMQHGLLPEEEIRPPAPGWHGLTGDEPS
jgi:HD-GYP domain-containing protein (c-di-GMP phosphodiesterase class II)